MKIVESKLSADVHGAAFSTNTEIADAPLLGELKNGSYEPRNGLATKLPKSVGVVFLQSAATDSFSQRRSMAEAVQAPILVKMRTLDSTSVVLKAAWKPKKEV